MSVDQGPITVVLAADSLLIGDGLAALLAGVAAVLGAHSCEELLQLVESRAPEAAITSIRTPVVTTMATIGTARRPTPGHPGPAIVVIADSGSGCALEPLRGGSSRVAYLLDERLPTIQTVIDALRDVPSKRP